MIFFLQFLKSIACFFFFFAITSSSLKSEGPDEDLFIRLYGRDRHLSGRWRRVRYFREDTEKLENISIQAHVNAGLGCDDTIHSAVYDTRALNFDSAKYWDARPRIDVIIYSVKRAPENNFYLTKGLKSGCVHYLENIDDNRFLVFKLGKHVCGIDLPAQEPMLTFLQKS